jgi:hypothetical protein
LRREDLWKWGHWEEKGVMWWLSCSWEGERRLEGRSGEGELVRGCGWGPLVFLAKGRDCPVAGEAGGGGFGFPKKMRVRVFLLYL